VLEGLLWGALSATAGFVEEVVYRGYLQRQFAAWTGRPRLALVLQAVVFGVTHGYQGVDACIRITVFGLLFGVVAAWRRSLRPGMMAHGLTDLVAGLCRS
jgi:membrane protease YdiL (CAAX protease family)